jgi:hypothetical protein
MQLSITAAMSLTHTHTMHFQLLRSLWCHTLPCVLPFRQGRRCCRRCLDYAFDTGYVDVGMVPVVQEASKVNDFIKDFKAGKNPSLDTIPGSECLCKGGAMCQRCSSAGFVVSPSKEYCLVLYNPCCSSGGADAGKAECSNSDQCQDLDVSFLFGNGLALQGGTPGSECCASAKSGAAGLLGSRGACAASIVVTAAAAALAGL